MNLDTAAFAGKGAATSIAAYAFLTLSPMAWAAALLGAAMSYYFEPERSPRSVAGLLFGIAAMGFAAAMLAAAAPQFPFVGAAAAEIAIEIRAGLLGLVVGLLYEQGKRWLGARSSPGGATP